MTSLSATEPDVRAAQENVFPVKLTIALSLAALADGLFYGERVGISAVVFAIALTCGSLLANFTRLNRKRTLLAGAVVLAGLVPAIEEFNAVSLAFIVLALGVGLLLITGREAGGLADRAAALRDLFLIGPFRFFRDTIGVFNLPALTTGLTIWFIPLLLGSIFAVLFISANPLLEKWISLMSPGNAASYVSFGRVLFWAVALSVVSPFIHVWWRARTEGVETLAESIEQERETPVGFSDFFGVATILRSLILFNLLFAIQTILDVIFLWGNVALPADITYAAYAHRGAYPLILTALLAAGFVLVAMRPGGPAEHSKVIRPLVYLWVAQNVLLVASSILRLDLYVQMYLLTYWRVAAFIWMLLVALGLLLIVARIILRRSDTWLIHANLIALTATIYICALVNFAALIADYNVSHSREASGKGAWFDTNYLVQLGPQALPAIDKAILMPLTDRNLVSRRDSLVEQQRKDMASWRSWGFRSWRLQRLMDDRQKSSAG